MCAHRVWLYNENGNIKYEPATGNDGERSYIKTPAGPAFIESKVIIVTDSIGRRTNDVEGELRTLFPGDTEWKSNVGGKRVPKGEEMELASRELSFPTNSSGEKFSLRAVCFISRKKTNH